MRFCDTFFQTTDYAMATTQAIVDAMPDDERQRYERSRKEIEDMVEFDRRAIKSAFLAMEAARRGTTDVDAALNAAADAHTQRVMMEQNMKKLGALIADFSEHEAAERPLANDAPLQANTKLHVYAEFLPRVRSESDTESDCDGQVAENVDGVLFGTGIYRTRGVVRMSAISQQAVADTQPKERYRFASLTALKQYYTQKYAADVLVPLIYKWQFTLPSSYCQFVFICESAAHARRVTNVFKRRPSDLDGHFIFSHAWLADKFANQ
jgi:hypothetical protein